MGTEEGTKNGVSGGAAVAAGERVAILDAGSQFGKLIDRRCRELKVESVILPLDTSAYQLKVGKKQAYFLCICEKTH